MGKLGQGRQQDSPHTVGGLVYVCILYQKPSILHDLKGKDAPPLHFSASMWSGSLFSSSSSSSPTPSFLLKINGNQENRMMANLGSILSNPWLPFSQMVQSPSHVNNLHRTHSPGIFTTKRVFTTLHKFEDAVQAWMVGPGWLPTFPNFCFSINTFYFGDRFCFIDKLIESKLIPVHLAPSWSFSSSYSQRLAVIWTFLKINEPISVHSEVHSLC